jgi:hypothetical protein
MKFKVADCLGEFLRGNSYQVLMNQTVKGRTFPNVTLVLQGRFCLDGGPAQPAHVPQLKSPRTVHVVLETTLTKLEIHRQAHLHSSDTLLKTAHQAAVSWLSEWGQRNL